MTDFNPEFIEPQKAFEDAIKEGLLSTDKEKDNYAGKWMYMHTVQARNYFKNINFRNYIHTK